MYTKIIEEDGNTFGYLNKFGEFINLDNIESDVNLSTTISHKSYMEMMYKEKLNLAPFKRDIEEHLLEWKNDCKRVKKKVLQISGARQVGKTSEILKFAYKNYKTVLYFNLVKDKDYFINYVIGKRVVQGLEDMCKELDLPTYKNDKSTLLIIDEIQYSHEVYNYIRFMQEELKCDIVVSGSYLANILNKEFFIPIGNLEIINMTPLTFLEFCEIKNLRDKIEKIEYTENGLIYDKDVIELIKVMYNIYLRVGGYPDIINTYILYEDLDKCGDMFERLLDLFLDEVSEEKSYLIFKDIYDYVITSISREKKGKISDIYHDVGLYFDERELLKPTRKEIVSACRWLTYNGLLKGCNRINGNDINSIVHEARYYLNDCGLTMYLARKNRLKNSDIKGLLTETFVFNELNYICGYNNKNKLFKDKIPNFAILNDYELDFIMYGLDEVTYGIEAKTTSGGTKSLNIFLDKNIIDKGIIVKDTLGGKTANKFTIPPYYLNIFFKNQIKRKEVFESQIPTMSFFNIND